MYHAKILIQYWFTIIMNNILRTYLRDNYDKWLFLLIELEHQHHK